MYKYDYKICPDCGREDCDGNCDDLPRELWKEIYGPEKAERLRKTIKGKTNFSKTIPRGRTVRTSDGSFEGNKNYIKPGYENNKTYRRSAVLDTNELDELALVKLYGNDGKTGIHLPNYQDGYSLFRPFIETKDENGKPIKISEKFVEQHESNDLSIKDIQKIRRALFNKKNKKVYEENSSKIIELKKRRKKEHR